MTAPTVACVLRHSATYDASYVARLRDGVARHLPAARFVCLSDVDVPCKRIPLEHDWPGWWAKMELFRPDIAGDLLYFDLDTVICGDLSDIAAQRKLTLLRDFYEDIRPGGLGSGMMMLPESERAAIWYNWKKNPRGIMETCGRMGDQNFLERFWTGCTARWQDVVPGQVVSYKVHVRRRVSKRDRGNGQIPPAARVVCFHGNPRPPAVGWLDAEVEHHRFRAIRAPRCPADKTVFIVGGGPSAARADLAALRGAGTVIGVNKSAERLDFADFLFTADASYLRMREQQVLAFPGRVVAALPADYELAPALQLKVERVERRDDIALSDDPAVCCFADNSGFGAFCWAVASGAKRIVLIGFDMTGPGHWHGGYDWRCRKGSRDYPVWARAWHAVAAQLTIRGVEVVNTNPASAIRCFPHVPLRDLVGEAAA